MAISPLNYWPFDFEIRSILPSDSTSERFFDDVGGSLAVIKPTDAKQSTSRLSHSKSIKKSSSSGVIGKHDEGTAPAPIIATLVAWLVLIFTSYGYPTPRNKVVITFVLAALLISNWLYLILGMDIPFSGPIRISSAPLQ
ncbi:hypothetical protein AB4Z52_07305 [Rhizobium sp. 2YAF20]